MSRRRISHQRPELHLLRKERLVVLTCRGLYAVMLRIVALDHRFSRQIPPACTACRLTKKRKSPLCRPVVTDIKGKIRRQHPDQGDIWKIMSLYDHLGTDQNIGLLICKRRENSLVAFLPSC